MIEKKRQRLLPPHLAADDSLESIFGIRSTGHYLIEFFSKNIQSHKRLLACLPLKTKKKCKMRWQILLPINRRRRGKHLKHFFHLGKSSFVMSNTFEHYLNNCRHQDVSSSPFRSYVVPTQFLFSFFSKLKFSLVPTRESRDHEKNRNAGILINEDQRRRKKAENQLMIFSFSSKSRIPIVVVVV